MADNLAQEGRIVMPAGARHRSHAEDSMVHAAQDKECVRHAKGLLGDCVLEGTVEIDETFVGGKNKNRHWDKKVEACQGRCFKDKTPVFVMIQRGGRVIARVVKDTKAQTLFNVIRKCVKRGSNLHTDEWNYGKDADTQYNHSNVNHSADFYGSGDLTTNHIEGFWGVVKRSVIGVYYHWSRKHMQRYVDECVFRYNTRDKTEPERFCFLLLNSGHRLTYKQLVYGQKEKTDTNKCYTGEKIPRGRLVLPMSFDEALKMMLSYTPKEVKPKI